MVVIEMVVTIYYLKNSLLFFFAICFSFTFFIQNVGKFSLKTGVHFIPKMYSKRLHAFNNALTTCKLWSTAIEMNISNYKLIIFISYIDYVKNVSNQYLFSHSIISILTRQLVELSFCECCMSFCTRHCRCLFLSTAKDYYLIMPIQC